METAPSTTKRDNLFQVFLRLRPRHDRTASSERFLTVEPPSDDASSTASTHVTLSPPGKLPETFGFTQVLEEDASQLDVFHCTGVLPLVEGVLAPHGGDGTDAMLAALGTTGSGKSHTLLGSRSQRGMTQLALDVVFRSIGHNIADVNSSVSLEASVQASDMTDATVLTAPAFLETVFADFNGPSRANSRAPTPMTVRNPNISISHQMQMPESGEDGGWARRVGAAEGESSSTTARDGWVHASLGDSDLPGVFLESPRPRSVRIVRREDYIAMSSPISTPSKTTDMNAGQAGLAFRGRAQILGNTPCAAKHFMAATASTIKKNMHTKIFPLKGEPSAPPPTPRRHLPRPNALPSYPDVSAISVSSDPSSEYVVLISMYELYNDKIFDLLGPAIKQPLRRQPLMFRATEFSPDRKVVAGLRKVVCTDVDQALMVLQAGLHERTVAGTERNRVSSRSHGFFCVEVKKRKKSRKNGYAVYGNDAPWAGSTLTIVDLAGTERNHQTKTTGTTLVEAGAINSSLMYVGQCLQCMTGVGGPMKVTAPHRRCKLTEVLFTNNFAPANMSKSQGTRRAPQKGVLIVTADPRGDLSTTLQTFKYSALAVEARRAPSISETLKIAQANQPPPSVCTNSSMLLPSSPISSPPIHHRPFFPPGSGSAAGSTGSVLPLHYPHSPNVQRTFSPASNASSSDERATMEAAALEIARLSEELEYMRSSLSEERSRRVEAEDRLMSLEDRLVDLEQEIREDCFADFERRLEVELARWRASVDVERERGEEHFDRKLEVLQRLHLQQQQRGGAEDGEVQQHDDKENVLVEGLEEENERLRRELLVLKRELAGRSPTKRRPLAERDDLATAGEDVPSSPPVGNHNYGNGCGGGNNNGNNNNSNGNLQRKMEQLRVAEDGGRGSCASNSSRTTSNGSPRKIRKLAPKRWDAADDDDMF